MAEVTRKRTGEHLRVLFQILMEHPDGMRARDALAELASRVTLTPYEAGSYAAGGRRFEKIIRFSTIDCVRAGWLQKQTGRWSITEEGQEAYRAYPDAEQFYRTAVALYQAWKKIQPEPEEVEESDEEEAGTAAAVTLEETWSPPGGKSSTT